jgi:NtrC-family two-component system sensor histidine kinase KinB
VPLIDPDNAIRGALTVVSNQRYAFATTDVRHLTSFSIQASVAIYHAELHTQLTRQRLMLEAVLRDIGDGLIVYNARGEAVLTNPVGHQVLHDSNRTNDHIHADLQQISHELLAGQELLLSREISFGQDENEQHYQVFASPVRVEDDEDSLVALVLHDITSQKLQERQRVEFISMVSHELRNPLNTLSGFLKVVLQGQTGELSELQHEFLSLADEQAQALKGRIKELLEFNRLESGRLSISPEPADLTDLIVTTCARLQMQAEQAGLSLEYSESERLPELLIDSERIGQVLTNLIENAIKATPSGGQIRVATEQTEDQVIVHVSDTGTGIPAEQQQKIFSRFYRLEHKGSQMGVHLGLGLSICQQIVEDHRGRIWVESTEGEGSRFSFELPITQRSEIMPEPVES